MEGERLLLQKLLTRKFGELPGHALARLERAVEPEPERWAERVLTAAPLDEVFEA